MRFRSWRDAPDGRGAAAVMVGAALTALLGSVALTVDLGHQRSTHRAMVTASDAASLAAAFELNTGASQNSACARAAEIVLENQPGATMTDCSLLTGGSGAGVVSVTVSETINYRFAPILGFESSDVASTTMSLYGEQGVRGVRPFGLCMSWLNGLPQLNGWDQSSSVGPIEVDYGNGGGQANACGGASGNWGSLDFDGGSNSNYDQKEWIADGFDDPVYPDTWVEGNPGAMAGWAASSLDALINSGETFPVPLFTSVTEEGGANAEFHIVGFAMVELTDYRVKGSADSRTLDLIFHPAESFPGIQCCDPAGESTDVTHVGICANDDTDISNC